MPEEIPSTLEIGFHAVGHDRSGGHTGRTNKFVLNSTLSQEIAGVIRHRFRIYHAPGRFIPKWRSRKSVITDILVGKDGKNLEITFRNSRSRRAVALSDEAPIELAEIIAEAVECESFTFQNGCSLDKQRYAVRREAKKGPWRCRTLRPKRPQLRVAPSAIRPTS